MADKTNASTSGQSQSNNSPQLNIVLIGGRDLFGNLSGKSSSGNFILGENVFDTSRRTAQSEARQQEVYGRRVTVVDTPGWWWHYPRAETPKLDQTEIHNSVHLCPPGPHVFLLVIHADLHLSQFDKLSLKQHLDLFGTDILSNTIVLFTAVDPRSEKQLQSKTETSSTLQWILQQCGNRKHVLNISDREDKNQIRLLIEKIEAVIGQNRGRHISVDISKKYALSEKLKFLAERASKRHDDAQIQRQNLRALIEGGKVLPQHLKLVIVGAQYAARSSTGNTILGKNAFKVNENGKKRTMCCEISHGMVEGRRLTVVDSPGWFFNHTLQDTNEMDKLEIENSVHLCSPGPHAVLLVIVLATAINKKYKRAVRKHMGLFREEIWKHTIIVFTRGDWLGVKTIEERIESEEGLQWLVNKCGNRYHVLNNMDHSDKNQVKELLEKIEEMCAGNEDPYYEVDMNRAAELEAKKEAGDEMARRLKRINEQKSRILKEVYGDEQQRASNIRIVIVGQKSSGKSLAGNTILFNEMFDMALETNRSKKDGDQRTYSASVKHEGNFAGVKVSVVETPGWLRDPAPPDWIKDEVLHSVSMCSPGPHVFLLVLPISRTFTEKDLNPLLEVLKPLTEKVWRHCMVLFTWGNWINDLPVENYIVREGKELQELLERCGNRYYVLNDHYDDPVQVKELLQKCFVMITRNKGCFTTEGLQNKFLLLPWQAKKRTLKDDEWKKRENELMERVLKALSKEPEEATGPSVKVAQSMNNEIPDMCGDVASENGSISKFRNQRAHENVAEWLANRFRQSDISSGIGSTCTSSAYRENLDENPQVELPVISPFNKIKRTDPLRILSNTGHISYRNSF